MISNVQGPSPTTRSVPLSRALIGGAQPPVVGGPLSPAPYKEMGGGGRPRDEVHRALQPPIDTTYRSRLGARPTGSSIQPPPSLTTLTPPPIPWSPAQLHQALVQVFPSPISLFLSPDRKSLMLRQYITEIL
jgi:hypothetical protein